MFVSVLCQYSDFTDGGSCYLPAIFLVNNNGQTLDPLSPFISICAFLVPDLVVLYILIRHILGRFSLLYVPRRSLSKRRMGTGQNTIKTCDADPSLSRSFAIHCTVLSALFSICRQFIAVCTFHNAKIVFNALTPKLSTHKNVVPLTFVCIDVKISCKSKPLNASTTKQRWRKEFKSDKPGPRVVYRRRDRGAEGVEEQGYGEGVSPSHPTGVLGSVVSSPEGYGRSPVRKRFLVHFEAKNQIKSNLFASTQAHTSRNNKCKTK